MMYILLFLLFVTGDHCSCFSDDRVQPDTAIFKSDGSDVYAYILCTWWPGVATTKTRFKLPILSLMIIPGFGNELSQLGHNAAQIVSPEARNDKYKRKILAWIST